MANKIGIVLALDGEQKFANGMKNANNAAKSLDRELKALSEDYKGSSDSVEYLEKKQSLLQQKQEAYTRKLTEAKAAHDMAKEAYRLQAQEVDRLRESLQEAESALSKMDASSKGYDKQTKAVQSLQHQLSSAEGSLVSYSGKLDKWDSNISAAEWELRKNSAAIADNKKNMDDAGTSADKLAASIGHMGEKAQESKSLLSKVIDKAPAAIANVAIDAATQAGSLLARKAAEGIKEIVRVGSEFEAAMSEVEAISGATGSALDAMSDKAKQLGASTKFSATEVAQGFKYMSLAGWDTEQMLSSIEGVVNLAAAAQMDLGEASDMVTDYLSAFGLEAENAGRMADQMAYAQANSNTTVQMLGQSYANCAADMHAAGQDMETTTSILEAMANQGTKGAQAGTALSAMMRDISQKMEDGAIMIGNTAVAVQDSSGNFRDLTDILRDVEKATEGMGTADRRAALQKTFTARSMKAVNEVLTEGVDKVAGYEEALRNADGAAAKMAATMQDNIIGQGQRLKSAAEGLGIAIYDGIKEPLSNLAGMAADALGAITDFITPEKTEMQQFLAEIAANNELAADSFRDAQETMSSAVSDVAGLERYKTILLELNNQENLNEYQKYQLKAAVDALKGSIPELGAAFDETTGKVDLEREAIEKLIDAQQDQILANAKAKASQEAMEALFQANLAAEQAKASVTAAEGRKKALEDEKQELLNLANEYLNLSQNNMYRSDEETARMEKIGQRMKELGYNANEAQSILAAGAATYDAQIQKEEKSIQTANKALGEATETATRAEEAYQTIEGSIDAAAESTKAATKAVTQETLAREKSTEAVHKERQAKKIVRSEESAATAQQKKDTQDQAKSTQELRKEYDAALKKTQEANEKCRQLNHTYQELKDSAEGYQKAQKEASQYEGINEDRYEKALYDMTRYKAVWTNQGHDIKDAQNILADYIDQMMEAEDEWARAADKSKELRDAFEDVDLGDVALAVKAAADALGIDFPEMAQKAQTSIEEFAQKGGQKLREEMEKIEQISKTSANNIKAAWKQLQDEAKNSLKFDLFSDFSGGTDQTVEEMNRHMQSQIDGLKNYADNLEIVAAHVGKEIAPEFMSYLEGMGTDGANALEHIVRTLNQDNGSELLKQWSDGYMEALSLQDQISNVIAGDQAALTDGLKALGSSDADFSVLSDAISSGLSGADADLQEKIQSLADTAQSIGATIPDGLTDAISSGEIDADGIENQLNAAIQGAMEGLLDVAKENGAAVPEGLAEGIESGTADVQYAYDTLISSIATSTSASSAMSSAGKEAFTTPLAAGIAEGQGEVVSAVSEVTQAAAEAAGEGTAEFSSAGKSAAEEYAQGITSGSSAASSAANTIASAARAALESQVGGFSSVGSNIAAGVASGIAAGQSAAINAAVNMATATLRAAKAALDIHSPSKKFIKDVGKQITAGTAFGIKQGTPLTAAEAGNMASATLVAATSWLTRYKKKHKVTKDDEMYFWKQMTATAQAGTAAYDKVVEKTISAGISAKFGVSRKTTTGTGKNKKTIQKDDETYYGDILSAAQDYFEMLTMYQDMSIQAELKYWQQVQSKLQKGTTAYVNAAQKIKDIKEKIGGFDVASDLIDSFQVYQEMSEKAVMQYWDLIRKQYASGTDDRIKADRQYFEAKKKYTDKLKDLEEDYAAKVKEVNDKYKDALDERTKAIAGAFDIFAKFESESETGEQLLFNMKTQAEGYKFWREQLSALGSRGILNADLMEELSQKGPEDTAAVYALNSLSDEQLAEYNNAYRQKMDQARQQATADEKDLAQTTARELQQLAAEYSSSVASVNTNLNTQIVSLATNIRSIASDQTNQIVAAINAGFSAQAARAAAAAQVAQQTKQSQVLSNTAASSQSQAAANQAAQAAAEKQAKLKASFLKIVQSGSKRSKKLSQKDKDNHAAIWEYLVSKYGYAPGNTQYKQLGKLFGVSVSNTVTGAQKTAILKKIKAAGFRRGTKRLEDELAWMDEEGPGSELVISRRDNAILTRLPAGAAIAPANLTDNLWQWGEFSPSQFLTEISRQQAVMSDMIRQTSGTASMRALNNRMQGAGGALPVSTQDTQTLGGILSLLSQYLPYIQESKEIYLDKDKVTAAMSDHISRDMGLRSNRRRR